ncbi:MAG: tetratricopeptide repeat protein [Magnetococcales bacterium]|nr:tetratricopeptide repeat protein [Magnetococcales bacterium]
MSLLKTPKSIAQTKTTVDYGYKQAIDYINAERYEEADQLCTSIVQDIPHHTDAINLLGVIAQKIGRDDLAVKQFHKAIDIDSNKALFYYNLGTSLYRLGQFDDAIKAQKQAINIDSDYIEAYSSLGAALLELEKFDEAIKYLQKAITINTNCADCYYNIALALKQQDKFTEALLCYEKAIAINPGFADAYYNMGIMFHEQKMLDRAAFCYNKTIAANPNYVNAYVNLANIQQEEGSYDEAIANYHKAISLNPDYSEVYNNLGCILKNQKKYDEAIEFFNKAITINPDYIFAHGNLGFALQEQGKIDQAILSYKNVLSINPDIVDIHSQLIGCIDLSASVNSNIPHTERKRWFKQFVEPIQTLSVFFKNKVDPKRIIRIGYVGADFYNHSAAYIFGCMLLNFDKSKFEVFCYAGHSTQDELTEQFKQNVTKWLYTSHLDDATLADTIREDCIDILVDLSGHTPGNRLLTFARKPAPIQISAWGYPFGTSMATMDYLFADPFFIPTSQRNKYVEQIIDLPCVIHMNPSTPPVMVTDPPACKNGYVTFGAFNRLEKYNDEVYNLWAEILHCIPNAKLMLKTVKLDSLQLTLEVKESFQKLGIPNNRLLLMGKTTRSEHLKAHAKIDIMLDPFPHNSGMTTLESLYMGVPVLTCETKIRGPISSTILNILEIDEFRTQNDREYVEKAVNFAKDIQYLKSLRYQLRNRFENSVLGDSKLYTEEVETIYRQLWKKWCEDSKLAPNQA